MSFGDKHSDSDWLLNIKEMSWTEDTENQVGFIIKTLELTGSERILDLACGFGRHSLSLARRGFSVVGVDITKAFIDDAKKTAEEMSLDVGFYQSDILDVTYENEFDVVLSLADGAIGYLKDDAENLKFFDVVSRALKTGGKYFLDICNADHAEMYFPKKHWEVGKKSLSLAQFDWYPESKRMKYEGDHLNFGEVTRLPNIDMNSPGSIRLYSLAELQGIFEERNMEVISSFSDYYGKPNSNKELQLIVYSRKK